VRTTLNSKLLGLLLSAVLCLPLALAQSKPDSLPSQHSMGSRRHYVGLPNFAEVSPNLFRGGQPGVDGLEALKKLGVSIIVDMRGTKSSHEELAVKKLGMRYVAIPWHCPFPADPVFARFLKLIQANPGKKIFVHCRLGDDRTGMAVAAYRMADEGWSAQEALKEMEEFGFTGAHHAICPTLAFYEKHFPEHLKTNPTFKDVKSVEK
jgi:protein tyrosine phosphatase (PTP) superfamily phosphohydrolase (DUF442 family)